MVDNFLVAVIISFVNQFGSLVFADKPPVMTDLINWISDTDEGSFHSRLQQFECK